MFRLACDRRPQLGASAHPRPPRRFDTDERLVAAVRAGSEPAFQVIYERHHAAVRGLCRKMLASDEEADDAAQHAFMAAYVDIMRAPKPIALRPWLLTIARHRCLTVIASRGRASVVALEESAGPAFSPDPDVAEDLRAVIDDIARLPDDQRAALVLRELGGASYEEIAELLEAPVARGRSLVFQARSWLRTSRRAREIPCAEIRKLLSSSRGATLRRRELSHHVRQCEGCRAFAAELRAHRRRLRSLLPLGPLAGLKRALVGSFVTSTGGGGGALLDGGVALKAIVIAALAGGGGVAGLAAGAGSAKEPAAAPHIALTANAGAIDPAPARSEGPARVASAGKASPRAGKRADAPPAHAGDPDTGAAPGTAPTATSPDSGYGQPVHAAAPARAPEQGDGSVDAGPDEDHAAPPRKPGQGSAAAAAEGSPGKPAPGSAGWPGHGLPGGHGHGLPQQPAAAGDAAVGNAPSPQGPAPPALPQPAGGPASAPGGNPGGAPGQPGGGPGQ
jgi:RNA polymerase sigma factor (sigma-70 family)